MPPQFKSIDEVLQAGFLQAKPFIPFGVAPGAEDELSKIQTYNQFVGVLQSEAKMSEEAAHLVASSTAYGMLEKFGINPSEWSLIVKPVTKGEVRYGAEEFNEAVKFLGSWTTL